jgi:hypothetical protein
MVINISYIDSDGSGLDTAGAAGKKKEEVTKLVEVTWLDSYTDGGWAEHAPETIMSKTYGILVQSNDEWVSLAMTKEEGYWGNLWYIPTRNVDNIRVIETIDE